MDGCGACAHGIGAHGSRMKPKHKRLLTVSGMIAVMAVAAFGILSSFREQLIYFYTPTDLQATLESGAFERNREVRVGGLVKEGSISTPQPGTTAFLITDLSHDIPASYTGLLPALFREGQGVVAQGKFSDAGQLQAATILAKHDENYMPQEVVDALKKSGRWQR